MTGIAAHLWSIRPLYQHLKKKNNGSISCEGHYFKYYWFLGTTKIRPVGLPVLCGQWMTRGMNPKLNVQYVLWDFLTLHSATNIPSPPFVLSYRIIKWCDQWNYQPHILNNGAQNYYLIPCLWIYTELRAILVEQNPNPVSQRWNHGTDVECTTTAPWQYNMHQPNEMHRGAPSLQIHTYSKISCKRRDSQ